MKPLTSDQKTKFYNILAGVYLDLIKDGKIGKVEQRVFAQKVLKNIEAATTYEEVLNFIEDMVKIYPAMQIARARLHDDVNKVHETQVMSHLQSFLKSAGASSR
ncbi:hypothetical protein COY90_03410 [Candidatus Roizmanbacteria bacterium CG_4_10_14_0_8_um_filter_39_9]|uniref:Uncharacterized protein n=1 Tax=Candidatus Roizmanbacteria bacterium CG_4_10_14_0_8_um_filter_39_9 TaxID=1974829 RepID=A0A2M7QCG6_9BACT|nr:MAG: hypothetical protein COY90_03410 [Candidatus Roizmanbacteria bacterium CG_4_10_14_0_8_um_filter_39_9]